jgi:transcriptional regulator with XRE-family HTH domain
MGDRVDEHLGRRLLHRRRALGLTQGQVASAIGVRFQQIQKYECGASRMSPIRLVALAQALDVEVAYFFEGLAAADTKRTPQSQGEPAGFR